MVNQTPAFGFVKSQVKLYVISYSDNRRQAVDRFYSLLSTVYGRENPMLAYELAELISQRKDSNKPYLEFLKVPDLSMGLYVLPANGTDLQSPHTEDEVYYIVSGKGKIKVADENRDVSAGSIVYVAKNVEHRFHSIEEELTILVFFAPAEYSNKS
jgi:mannose-6-phosphate isomerase-like protein (cupin superfamily)